MAKHPPHVLELAKHGAEVRLRELLDETKLLFSTFPHLRDSFDRDELPISFILAKGSGQLTRTRAEAPRRRLSAAARKAASERMKRYWASKRKAAK